MAEMQQTKATGDILALLFHNTGKKAKGKGDAQEIAPSPFRAVLEKSMKNDPQGNMKNALQAITRKKAESTGLVNVAIESGIVEEAAEDSVLHLLKSFISEKTMVETGETASAEIKTNHIPLVSAAMTTAEREILDLLVKMLLSGGPVVETTAQPFMAKESQGGEIPLQLAAAVEEEALSSLCKKAVSPGVNPLPEGAPVVFGEKVLMESVKEMDRRSIPAAAFVQTASEAGKTQIEASVAEVLKTSDKELSQDAANQIAAEITVGYVDVLKNGFGQTDADRKGAAPLPVGSAEALLKSKVTEILTNNGLGQEAAQRIADQVKKVIFVKEPNIPKMDTPTPLFEQTMSSADRQARQASSAIADAGVPVARKMPGSVPKTVADKTNDAETSAKPHMTAETPRKDFTGNDAKAQIVVRGEVALKQDAVVRSSVGGAGVMQEAAVEKVGAQGKPKASMASEAAGLKGQMQPGILAGQTAGLSDTSTPAPLPVRAQEIIAQITDLKNAQSDQMGRVKIVLDPPHLGNVEMDIVLRGDRVSAVMTSENKQVQQILQSHAEEIKQALSDQGFRIDRIEVRHAEEKGNPSWSQNDRERNQPQDGGYRQHREKQPQEKFEMPDHMVQFNAVA